MDENTVDSMTIKLELLWDRIQELKHSDPFQAQVMYEKYKALGDALSKELPPPIPSYVVEDQAVS